MTKLRIMSNNLWWCDGNHAAWEAIGADCSAVHRAPGFARVYAETLPDIIGLQECSARMSHALMTQLTEKQLPYCLVWGRDTPILYRRDKFQLVDQEVRIYPEDIPGLEGSFNNLKTKSYCIAVLRCKDSGQKLIFATTHLWYKSEKSQPGSEAAKVWQLDVLMDRLDALQAEHGCGAVMVGDLNTWPGSRAVQRALQRGFVHAHDAAAEFADDSRGLHRCDGDGYDTQPAEGGFEKSLDHILVRGGESGSIRRFERYAPDWYMPLSDHFPVWIDVTF